MSKIKSALELALERTADVAIDQDAVRKEEIIKQGKALVARFLNDGANVSLHSEMDKHKSEEKKWIKDGMLDTLLANLTLPQYETDLERLPRIAEGLKALTNQPSSVQFVDSLITQYRSIFTQYLNSCDQLVDQLREQWEPRLQQKEEALRKQTGQVLKLSAEQDPEFTQMLSEHFAQLDSQYNQVLNQGKDEIRKMI